MALALRPEHREWSITHGTVLNGSIYTYSAKWNAHCHLSGCGWADTFTGSRGRALIELSLTNHRRIVHEEPTPVANATPPENQGTT